MPSLKGTSSYFVTKLELLFFKWGRFVAVHPYQVILSCFLATACCSLGLLKFRAETKANLLWIPQDSEYNTNQDWVDENFMKSTREEFALFKAENVLTPDSLQQMLAVHQAVGRIEKDGKRFHNICARVPIAADVIEEQKRRKKRQALMGSSDHSDDYYENFYDEYLEEDDHDESNTERIDFNKYSKKVNITKVDELLDDISQASYCALVSSLEEKCIKTSLLEIWSYKEHLINTVTREEILTAVNMLARSPWYGYDVDYASLLGGITRNSSGHIVGAKTAQMVWVVEVPEEGRVISAHSGVELEFADPTTLAWESDMIETVLGFSSDKMEVMVNAARSLGDVSTQSIFFDAALLGGGYTIMFIYTILMLGRLNTLEVRLMLAMAGIVSIGMGFVIGIGISSLMGFPVTPVHALLPFLCLGIGIDDMFVIAQCWSNMKKNPLHDGLSHPEQIGSSLKHAGVAVTVTTLTDVFAFGVGAVTQMPGLAAFCVCTAISLGAIYLLQISWFAAWMSLDEERIAAGRDGLVPCIVHKDYQPSACTRTNYGDIVVKQFVKLLSSSVFKYLVITATLGFLGFGIRGSLLMRQKFDPVLLLPSDSYLRRWKSVHDQFYYGSGWTVYRGEIYSANFNHSDLHKFEQLSSGLQQFVEEGQSLGAFDSWWSKLKEYATQKKNFTSWEDFANPTDFKMILSDFLFSPYGFNYKSSFKFEDELVCNQPAPRIKASKFKMEYLSFAGPEHHIPAKKLVTDLVTSSNIPGGFSHVQVYTAWETDEIIGFELMRNIGLALGCVFIITLVLLANLPICLLVLNNVVITLADIVGFLHFWGITIDIVSCITIVLAIGLCVDYSVHIGHAYLVSKGSRLEKVTAAMTSIGPAVFNGGLTTFLALVLLGGSTSHVFVTFFKVFVLTAAFGLFHGLVLFPVLLSIVGPYDEPLQLANAVEPAVSAENEKAVCYANSGFSTEESISKKERECVASFRVEWGASDSYQPDHNTSE